MKPTAAATQPSDSPTAAVPQPTAGNESAACAATQLLTISQGAKLAGVSRQTLSTRIQRGTIPATRIEENGRLVSRVSVDDLEMAYPGCAAVPQPAQPLPMTSAGLKTVDRAIEAASLARETSTKAVQVLDRDSRQALVRAEQQLQLVRQESKAELRQVRAQADRRGAGLLLACCAAVGLAVLAWTLTGRADRAEVMAADRAAQVGELGSELIDAKASVLAAGTRAAALETQTELLSHKLEQTAASLETARNALQSWIAANATVRVLRRLFD